MVNTGFQTFCSAPHSNAVLLLCGTALLTSDAPSLHVHV